MTPVWYGLPWIESAVKSIEDQTFQDWELIIVDDGSTDNTLEILERMKNEDPRIILIPTKGVGRKALNIALSKCRADFIANLDGGGLAHPKGWKFNTKLAKKSQIRRLLQSKYHHKQENKIGVANTFKYSASLKDVTRLLAYKIPVNHSPVFVRRGLSSKQELQRRTYFAVRLAVGKNCRGKPSNITRI